MNILRSIEEALKESNEVITREINLRNEWLAQNTDQSFSEKQKCYDEILRLQQELISRVKNKSS